MFRNLIFIFVLINFTTTIYSKTPVNDLFESGGKLIKYIASDGFSKLKEKSDSFVQIDSIFKFALQTAEENFSEALLFCSLATLTYNHVNLRLPLTGTKIRLNFYTKLDTVIYDKMRDNLPARFFEDSPEISFGDVDKLTHFFSSAYLAYNFGENFSNQMGLLVEHFEETFEAQNKVDSRDLKMNKIGREFGKKLKKELIYPSEIIKLYKKLSDA